MINAILITSGARPELLEQSLRSIHANAAHRHSFNLTVVVDGYKNRATYMPWAEIVDHLIVNMEQGGASRARNIGASSIPKYRRQKFVMFLDDDVYMCPKWDEKLLELGESVDRLTPYGTIETFPGCIVSGHAHPFNHSERQQVCDFSSVQLPRRVIDYEKPLVISTVNMLMPWELWDDVGYFVEPGGPGGSEDYDYCMRAKAKGYGFAVSEPQCVLHTGIWSSSGKPIVGQSEVAANNQKLMDLYGLNGKVTFG